MPDWLKSGWTSGENSIIRSTQVNALVIQVDVLCLDAVVITDIVRCCIIHRGCLYKYFYQYLHCNACSQCLFCMETGLLSAYCLLLPTTIDTHSDSISFQLDRLYRPKSGSTENLLRETFSIGEVNLKFLQSSVPKDSCALKNTTSF